MKIAPLNDIDLIEETASSFDGKKYLVGGCVRDWLLKKKCDDLDFVFEKYPKKLADKIAQKKGAKADFFEKFLTIRIIFDSKRVDMAAFRKEKYSFLGALPETEIAKNIEEDLKRRDFKSNAMAISLNEKDKYELIDPYGGFFDIKNKTLSVLHKKSFFDDPTRLFRAARFCSRFSWQPSKETLKLISEAVNKNYVSAISKERIRNEILKILVEEKPYGVFLLLKKWGLLGRLYPALTIKKELDSFSGLEERLAFLSACHRKSADFIVSLNLRRELKLKLIKILTPFSLRRAPQEEPCNLQKKIYSSLYKGKKLDKRFIGAGDLPGIKMEKQKFAHILNYLAGLQYKGFLKNKKQALKYIK